MRLVSVTQTATVKALYRTDSLCCCPSLQDDQAVLVTLYIIARLITHLHSKRLLWRHSLNCPLNDTLSHQNMAVSRLSPVKNNALRPLHQSREPWALSTNHPLPMLHPTLIIFHATQEERVTQKHN